MLNGKTKQPTKSNKIPVERSSGNVFDDLGLPEADELLAKAQLVNRISEIIAQREMTQVHAAKVLGIDQPKISALLRGRFDGYTSDRLFRFLNALGQDVEIVVRSTRKGIKQAHTRVISA
ncbi:MAG: helix-turn-helix transcriptional regulator [Gemmatales bacterium]